MVEMKSMNEEEFSNQVRLYVETAAKNGWDKQTTADWFCVRFHQEHQWGIACVFIDGKKEVAFVVPGSTDDTMRIAYIFKPFDPSMKAMDAFGVDAPDGIIAFGQPDRSVN